MIWPSSQFAVWLTEHVDHVEAFAPDATVIAYSNASFWNVWVADRMLAARLEWIVPRYPIYSAGGYVLHPVPPPPGWAGWAFARAPIGPFAPAGASWDGWQFSAGYNRQGPVYGCASSDLDLNFVKQDVWTRWTNTDVTIPPPTPPIGEPVKPYLFRLSTGAVGLRHESGSRGVSSGETAEDGPFADEPIYDIPPTSYWETYCKWELDKYERELEPPPPGTPGTPAQPPRYDGTITLTPRV